MTKEPVAIIAAVVGIIELVIPVALIFDLINWTDAQLGAVMALIIGIGTIVGGLFARSKVTPV